MFAIRPSSMSSKGPKKTSRREKQCRLNSHQTIECHVSSHALSHDMSQDMSQYDVYEAISDLEPDMASEINAKSCID